MKAFYELHESKFYAYGFTVWPIVLSLLEFFFFRFFLLKEAIKLCRNF
jgi:hypothetical protein